MAPREGVLPRQIPELAFRPCMRPLHLYRPMGLDELALLFFSDMRAFPARLPHQPIFYPVTHAEYAKQVARDWNQKSGALEGFVTHFTVNEAYAARFERNSVRPRAYEELWVPAEELAEFNDHILAPIDVIAAYFAGGYLGYASTGPVLAGLSAKGQLSELALALRHGNLAPLLGDASNRAAVFLNYFFWQATELVDEGLDDVTRASVLDALDTAWKARGERVPLGIAR